MGKSGPCTMSHSALSTSSTLRFAPLVSFSIRYAIASQISPTLCGGMLVAMPTAMPELPLTSSCGSRAGQHHRLFGLVVEVGDELDGLFVDVHQHVERGAREARFGVPVRGGRIGRGRAEVAVAVDQRVAQREVLRHAHERVVHRRVAVRVIALEHLADDAGALAVLLGRIEAHLAHRVQDAALHGLEAVAHVGERARRDDGHGIGEVALPHLVFDGDRGHPRVVWVHGFFLRSMGRADKARAAGRGAQWWGSPSPRGRIAAGIAADELGAVRIALLEQGADQEADDARRRSRRRWRSAEACSRRRRRLDRARRSGG